MSVLRRAWPALPLLLAVLAPACGRDEAPWVDLGAREPVRYPDRHPAGTPVRFALGSALVPPGSHHLSRGLLALLEERLGLPVKTVECPGSAAVIEALARGEIDVAFLCSGPYVVGHDTRGIELLAVPAVAGRPTHTSRLIVPAASPARSLADLRGRSFAFVEPLSLTGCFVPLAQAAEGGGNPLAFFGRTVFTGGHDASVRAVAGGLVDGAAVDSYILEAVRRERPDLFGRVRLLRESGPWPGPPVVVRPGLDPALASRLREVFLGLDRDEAGRAALRRIGVEGFVAGGDAEYDPVRRLRERFAPVAAAAAARRAP